MKIRGLSLTRPWPFAFTDGPEELRKRIENRGWLPPRGMMGHYVALHAAKSFDDSAFLMIEKNLGVPCPADADSRSSIIYAVGKLAFIASSEKDPRLGDVQPRWFMGPWAWCLGEFVVLVEPVECSGAMGLWDLPDNVLPKVRAAYRESVALIPGGPVVGFGVEQPALIGDASEGALHLPTCETGVSCIEDRSQR